MLKPVVSMNTMAMNESIATTCCYVWNGTSLAGAASLPHGGELVAKSNTTYYTAIGGAEMNKSWVNWTGGHVIDAYAAKNGHYHANLEGKGVVTTPNDADVLMDAAAGPAYEWVKLGFCSHNDSNCPYVKESKLDYMKHVGATSAHYSFTANNEWKMDHQAFQYAS